MPTVFKYEGTTNSDYTYGDIFGIIDGEWKRIHTQEEWNRLSNLNKEAIFKEIGNRMPSYDQLNAFTPFSMLTYSENEQVRRAKINFKPRNQVLIMNKLINITQFNRIISLLVNATEINGHIDIMITNGNTINEGLLYYIYDNEWKPALILHNDSKYNFLIEDTMSLTQFNKLKPEILNDLLQGASSIGFAFIFYAFDNYAKLKLNNILEEAELKGVWESTILGTDYTYAYPDASSMAVTFKKAGKYKINYYA